MKVVEQSVNPLFNLDQELRKVKILIPLLELVHNPMYQPLIQKIMNRSKKFFHNKTLNIQEDNTHVECEPYVEE